jgi:hypothetical protein
MSKEEPDVFGGKPETKSRQIAICFDTSALPSNISRHSDAKSGADLAAVITLIEGRASGKYQLLSSRLNDRELSETADPSQRATPSLSLTGFRLVIANSDIAAEEEWAQVFERCQPEYPIRARMLAARRDNLMSTIAALERRLAAIYQARLDEVSAGPGPQDVR